MICSERDFGVIYVVYLWFNINFNSPEIVWDKHVCVWKILWRA